MTTLVLEREPKAIAVKVTDEHLIVELDDGRTISVPLSWYPRLAHGTPEERNNYEIFGEGSAISWPDLDEDLSVESILAGRRSAESPRSFERWLASRARSTD